AFGACRTLYSRELERSHKVVKPNAEFRPRVGQHAAARTRNHAWRFGAQRIARRTLQARVSRSRRRKLAENDARKVLQRRNQADLRTGRHFLDSTSRAALRRGEMTRVYGRAKTSHRSNQAASIAEGTGALGRVRAAMAAFHECDHLSAGYCRKSRHT